MVNGSPALIPIIQKAGELQSLRLRPPSPFPARPARSPRRSASRTTSSRCNTDNHQAAIKAFLDFAYQDRTSAPFDNEYDLLPGHHLGGQR